MRVLIVCLVLLGAVTARAQSPEVKKYLNAAITLYENLEYEKALKQLKKARPKATGPDDEAKIGLLEGIVLADMGKEEQALTAFKTAFGIDLEAKLPVEVSPKVQAVAEKARDNVRKMLAPQMEAERLAAEKAKADEAAKAEAAARAEAERQAELKRQEDEDRKKHEPPPAVVKPAGPSVRSLSWIPLAVGVVSAGVAAGLLIDASSKYNALVNGTAPPADAAGYRDSGKTEATLGYVFIGVAAAGVAGAGLMYFLGAPGPQVAVVPLPGGAFASLSFALDLGGAR
jgi:tetratricopeptide (TPR) repeat protein